MRFKRIICLALCMASLICPVTVLGEKEENSSFSMQGGSHSIDAQTPILGSEQLIKNAEAVLLYEVKTDTLMYAWNADKPVYPASLVQIMTALLVIEKGNLKEAVTVSQEALESVGRGAASVGLKKDEVMSAEDLLNCMLVDSANDAAAVLAEHVSGSQSAFVARMNQRAQELGCTSTNFVNSTGLHDTNQVTTARDLCRILTEAIKHDEFRKPFGTVTCKTAPTNQSEERKLETGNFLMNWYSMEIYYDPRVTGGRTGVTQDGNRCIAATAEQDDLSFISIVMGAASEYEEEGNKVKSFGGFPETTQLLDMGFKKYKPAGIIYENQTLRQYPVINGSSDVFVCPRVMISTVLPFGTDTKDLTYRYREREPQFTAPIQKGESMGSVEIWNDGICIGQAELFAMNKVDVKESPMTEENIQQERQPVSQSTWIIVGIAGFVILAFFLRKLMLYRKKSAVRRRNSQNRRRSR